MLCILLWTIIFLQVSIFGMNHPIQYSDSGFILWSIIIALSCPLYDYYSLPFDWNPRIRGSRKQILMRYQVKMKSNQEEERILMIYEVKNSEEWIKQNKERIVVILQVKTNLNQKEELYCNQIKMSWKFYLNSTLSNSPSSPSLSSNDKHFGFIYKIFLPSIIPNFIVILKFTY